MSAKRVILTLVAMCLMAGTATAATLKIGSLSPLTGSYAADGNDIANGTRAAIAAIEKEGGIPGFDKIIDFNRGSKVTGAGFPFYVGDGAKLVRSLIQLFLTEGAANGYTEVMPPIFVNAASATASARPMPPCSTGAATPIQPPSA